MTRKQEEKFFFLILDMEEALAEEWWNALMEDEGEFSGKASGQCYWKKKIQKKF